VGGAGRESEVKEGERKRWAGAEEIVVKGSGKRGERSKEKTGREKRGVDGEGKEDKE